MRPAFSSTRSAAAFALLLLLLLLSPALAGKKILPPLEQSYASLSWGSGPYPWIRHEIFEETNDIDIAFMGSSHMFRDIDTPYVQAQLTEKLGRPAVVRTIAWGGAGYDVLYFIAKELLAHRKVHLLVFYDETNGGYVRNVNGTGWFQWAADSGDLAGLSFVEKSRFYFMALVGMPRNLLCRIRPNIPAGVFSHTKTAQELILQAPNPATRLGSMAAEVGFARDWGTYNFTPFLPFAPDTKLLPTDICAYSPATKSAFEFSNRPLPVWQSCFARKFAALANQQGCRLVMLHLPTTPEMKSPVISERAFWPGLLGVTLIGIPPAKLFAGMTEDDALKLYSDVSHMNKNGMEYFTRTITPTLLNAYDAPSQP